MSEKRLAVLSIAAQQCLYDLAQHAKSTDEKLFEQIESQAIWLEQFSSPVVDQEDEENEGALAESVRAGIEDLLAKLS